MHSLNYVAHTVYKDMKRIIYDYKLCKTATVHGHFWFTDIANVSHTEAENCKAPIILVHTHSNNME